MLIENCPSGNVQPNCDDDGEGDNDISYGHEL